MRHKLRTHLRLRRLGGGGRSGSSSSTGRGSGGGFLGFQVFLACKTVVKLVKLKWTI